MVPTTRIPTTRIKLTTASNRPSVRSVFPSDRKEEKKTRSGFSTHSNSTATPSKGKNRDSEITIRGSDREKEKEGSWGRKRGKRTPLLIKHLGGVERRKGESSDIRVQSRGLSLAMCYLNPSSIQPFTYHPPLTGSTVYTSYSPISLSITHGLCGLHILLSLSCPRHIC